MELEHFHSAEVFPNANMAGSFCIFVPATPIEVGAATVLAGR
jgi:hypothetical protein